jgi:thymidylate synthase
LPTIRIADDAPGIFKIGFDDIELVGYEPQPAIKAPIAV